MARTCRGMAGRTLKATACPGQGGHTGSFPLKAARRSTDVAKGEARAGEPPSRPYALKRPEAGGFLRGHPRRSGCQFTCGAVMALCRGRLTESLPRRLCFSRTGLGARARETAEREAAEREAAKGGEVWGVPKLGRQSLVGHAGFEKALSNHEKAP